MEKAADIQGMIKKNDNNMTAKEFLRNKKNEIGLRSQSSPLGSEGLEVETMIEFAKYHVEKALKEASVKATAYNKAKFKGDINPQVDIDSILNAYPLDLIK